MVSRCRAHALLHGDPFVTFTDERTSEVFKVCSDLFFFHIYSANKKNIDGEGHVMLTARGTYDTTIVLDR